MDLAVRDGSEPRQQTKAADKLQHSPQIWRVSKHSSDNPKQLTTAVRICARERLGEYVRDLRGCWYESWRDAPIVDDVAQPIKPKVQVLHATVMLRVLRDADRRLVVHTQRRSASDGEAKLPQ